MRTPGFSTKNLIFNFAAEEPNPEIWIEYILCDTSHCPVRELANVLAHSVNLAASSWTGR